MPFPAVGALLGAGISALGNLFSGPSPEELQKIHDDAVALSNQRNSDIANYRISHVDAEDLEIQARNRANYKGNGSVSDRGGVDSYTKNEDFAKNDILGNVASGGGMSIGIVAIVLAIVAYFFFKK